MAIGRISGSVLKSNLTRNGVDLAFETNLLYLDVTNSRVGIGTSEPSTALDVSGTITATALAGATATLTNTTTGDSLLLTTTEASSSAAPVITLKRNSGSPADADYLGQLKFKGENDADQEVTYAKITGKILDASDGSEDGLIEFAHKKAGSNVITARFRSDSFQLLNDTTLKVANITYPTSDGTAGQVITTDGSGNLSFSTISVGDLSIVGSTISSPSNADLTLATSGSGKVSVGGLKFPSGDGSANQVLATDGSGNLSFVDSGSADTDSTEAGSGDESTDLGTGTSVINSFNVATYDSAFYFLVTRDEVNSTLDLRRHSLTHNDSDAFVNTFGQVRSDTSQSYITVGADVDSNLARLTATGQSVSNSVSLYRIVLGPSTSDSTDGNTAFIVNSDVDSATENLDTWSASTYRGAQYFISATNSTTGEASNMEALVVTDGTDAYITPYGNVNTGNNDLIELSADVSGGNVRLRASGRAPNTRVAMYRILLGDSESSSSGTSVNVIGATTVSSASTTLDSFSKDDYHGAMYLVVGHNSTEGASSVQTVYMLNDGSDAYVANGPFVSSKGTSQLSFTASFSGGTATLSCQSTSGGSTTVNAYRIHLKRGAANTVTTNTAQTIQAAKTFSVAPTFNVGYNESINALTSSSTITVDCATARVHTVTLGTNTEFNITSLPTGGTVTLIITQDGTGSRTATFGTDGSAAVKFPASSSVLSTGANDIDVVSIFNDGTNFLGNIARNYG